MVSLILALIDCIAPTGEYVNSKLLLSVELSQCLVYQWWGLISPGQASIAGFPVKFT